MTLGSLFDGSGGFPLGAILCGITPVWAAEVEPFPIKVTKTRIPFMKHLGSVTEIDGAKIEPVDIITFGSPCQDLSIAGKREGLHGNRSGLFNEAIRIVKEMRIATNGEKPRYIVWENVTGAFSSNKGEDFRVVLEEVCKIKDESVSVPKPNKWNRAGKIMGDNYSVAWRTFDAQFWGVPQRRKRIYLVADFAGGSAGKILFESEGLYRYSAEGFRSWQTAAGNSAECSGGTGSYSVDGYNSSVDEVVATLGVNCGVSTGRNGVMVLNDQGGNRMDVTEDMTCTLRAESHHPPLVFENHSRDSRYTGPHDTVPTILSTFGTGGNNQPFVLETPKTLKIRSGCEGGGKGALLQDNMSATLSCNNDQTVFVPFCKGSRPHSKEEAPSWKNGEVANTLNTFDVGETRCNELVVQAYGICSKDSNSMKSDNLNSGFYEADTSRTLDGNGGNPSCNQGGIAVVAVQGSMIGRDDKNGPQGSGINEDVCFSLTGADRHAVAYGIDRAAYNQGRNALYDFAVEEELEPTMVAKGPGAVAHPTYCASKASFFTSAEEEKANTLVATDYKDPPIVNEPMYIVRRLTPTECARLQGFPDWWCADLETENPTDEDMDFWRDVFETHRKIVTGAKKPKTDKQIIKWLKNPHSDSAEYKMWGNGVALPNVIFVLSGIAALNFLEDEDEE